jgi:hypothetical protein
VLLVGMLVIVHMVELLLLWSCCEGGVQVQKASAARRSAPKLRAYQKPFSIPAPVYPHSTHRTHVETRIKWLRC